LGAGIDSVTATLSLLLPEAKVITVSGNVKDKNAIARFIRREADIVVGTQTVIHGLHAPGVSLVAVLVADVGLHSSDYRSGERSFQHIIEAAGRANCSFPSEVIIQTFTPEAKEMLFAQSFDTHGYAAYELAIRKKLSYPPFGTVIEVLDPSCSRSEINNAFLQAGVTAKISEGFADENKKKKFIIRADDEGKMLTALASFRVRYCIHR
jgi:primosomal protein N' (replication factor Y)